MRIIEEPIGKDELARLSRNFIDENVIKGVVDVSRGILAVDAPMHYDLDQLLLEDGSRQDDIWGINLYLDEAEWDDIVEFDSMINIRPAQNNRSRYVEDAGMRDKIKTVVAKWLK